MAENTTRQLDRWQKGEAITAYRLNQLVEAVNFLLNTTGYIFNRVALANYVPTDASSFNYPGILEAVETRAGLTAPRIEAGTLVLPEQAGGGLNAVAYDYTSLTPSIYGGTLNLNLANYEASSGSAFPGAMAGVNLYDPTDASSPSAPGITAGVLQLPAGLSAIENASGTITPQPAPGADGWVQTLLIKGSYQNGSLQFERWDRQLMRLHGTALQVVQQESFDEGNSWSDSSA